MSNHFSSQSAQIVPQISNSGKSVGNLPMTRSEILHERLLKRKAGIVDDIPQKPPKKLSEAAQRRKNEAAKEIAEENKRRKLMGVHVVGDTAIGHYLRGHYADEPPPPARPSVCSQCFAPLKRLANRHHLYVPRNRKCWSCKMAPYRELFEADEKIKADRKLKADEKLKADNSQAE